ncbi:USP16 family protein [Megaselia abdita]
MVKKKRQSDHDRNGSSTESSEEMKTSPSATDCSHTKKAIDTNRLRKVLKPVGLHKTCTECEKAPQSNGLNPVNDHGDGEEEVVYDNTLWLCLKCGSQLCGRSKKQHALNHFQTPRSDSHALSLNTTTLEIWCYECNKEVKSSRKNIQECTEFIRKLSQKPTELQAIPLPPPTKNDNILDNIQEKIMAGFDTMRPLLDDAPKQGPPKPPAMPYPGIAKRTTTAPDSPEPSPVNNLPRVRGLTNLGNTCFFNAVLQCLAQTPYLLDVLNELSEAGEEFILPGGKCKFQNGEEKDLPPIKGCLSSWGNLTQALAETLQELQSGGGVFTPSKLLNKLTSKCPQFAGGDQHDSHELLRQLLESVRSEDLQRYQKVILQNVGYKNQDINSVEDDIRKKCRMYGNQVSDRILRPEQVFRGFLVSTLTCQDCMYASSSHESFLDMSVPVSVEKPQPPNRRKNSPENSPIIPSDPTPSKHQIKKEKEKERKAKRAAKHKSKKTVTIVNGETEAATADGAEEGDSGSSEESDADIEDNLEESDPRTFIGPLNYDGNGNGSSNILESPGGEKRGDSPENHNKDDENDSGIAASPTANVVIEVGLSDKGANIVRQLSATAMDKLTNGYLPKTITESIENLSIQEKDAEKAKLIEERRQKRRIRTQSYSDWNTTIAPRYQCQDGECSVQSCLNNFTALELMTGSNKVGCEACTKRINGDEEKAKTVYTNATKHYLVSSPPAVLILHLKRFQVEPRGFFRKLARPVHFPITLDVAPFCGSKVKNLPNIDRKQKKLIYALYGIVEHAGGMYGGHYTAYVKVRPKLSSTDKRWKFLPQGSKTELDQEDEQKQKLEELCARQKARSMRNSMCQDAAENDSDDLSTSSSSEPEDIDETEGAVGGQNYTDPENIEPPPGKWYYVSDSRVQEVEEATVLKSQAYLLFYERIY